MFSRTIVTNCLTSIGLSRSWRLEKFWNSDKRGIDQVSKSAYLTSCTPPTLFPSFRLVWLCVFSRFLRFRVKWRIRRHKQSPWYGCPKRWENLDTSKFFVEGKRSLRMNFIIKRANNAGAIFDYFSWFTKSERWNHSKSKVRLRHSSCIV